MGYSRRSRIIAAVSLLGSIHAILVAIPGIWRSWMIIIEPIEGLILGPFGGAVSALIGSSIGRIIRPRAGILYIFGLGEVLGALTSGLIFKGRWRDALIIYAIMLSAYFIHPLGRTLPAWALWDIYIAFSLILLSPRLINRALNDKENTKKLTPAVAIASFIGIEADVLTRIFLLIPVGLYNVLGIPENVLPVIWMAGAVETPVESIISVTASIIIGVPLLRALLKSGVIEWPMT